MSGIIGALRRGHLLAASFAGYTLGVIAAAQHIIPALFGIVALGVCIVPARVRRETDARVVAAAIVVAMCVGASSAALAARHENAPPYASLSERHIVANAVALERPHATGSGDAMRVRILSVVSPTGPQTLALAGLTALLEFRRPSRMIDPAGRVVRVRARLTLPSGPRNDGEPAERDVLADQGVAVILQSSSPAGLAIGSPAAGVGAWFARVRSAAAKTLESRLPPVDAAVLEGILWGDRTDLPSALRQEFSDTGTVHVLTTAGLHLGIFAALIAALLVRLPLPRVARAAIVVAAAWAYAALAGMHLPTIRAATMLTSGTIAQESGRGRSPSAILAAAAYAVTLPHPLALLSPSFAMSFSCVGGIALLAPLIERAGLREGGGPGAFAGELLGTSVAVQAAMWPMQALYFDTFTPYAVLANMLVVPLVGVVMALGGALAIVSALASWLAAPIATLTWAVLSALVAIVERFATLPGAHVDVPPPTHCFIVAYWCALAALVWASRDPNRFARAGKCAAPVAATLVIIYCLPGIAAAQDRTLHLDAIDVGQADCLLIRAPGMHAMLVDGGGKLERTGPAGAVVAQPLGDVIAQRTVLPFLLRHWVLRLDAIVLTHPHGDHAGGLPIILAHENVGALWDSSQQYGGPAYRRTLEVVRERRIPWRRALRGARFDLGSSTHVEVLAPELPLLAGTSSDINNNSVVLRVTFGHTVMLLTGDAQSEAEARLLAHGGGDLRADVLKVGHHGSAYSSTPAFLAAVDPKIAIISCGLHNMFGHPSPKTLAALRAAGAMVYRTDLDGGIRIDVRGDHVTTKHTVH